MESMLALIGEYGRAVYVVLFLYSSLKNGALPLFAGYAAQQGMLDPVLVALVTGVGAYVGDELRFAVARRYGTALLSGRPRIAVWIRLGEKLLHRYGVLYIFLYRYPLGLRTLGALPLGLTDIKWRRFTVLSAVSATIWSLVLLSLGYVFGGTIERALAEGWAVLPVVLLLAAVLLIWVGIRRVAKKSKKH